MKNSPCGGSPGIGSWSSRYLLHARTVPRGPRSPPATTKNSGYTDWSNSGRKPSPRIEKNRTPIHGTSIQTAPSGPPTVILSWKSFRASAGSVKSAAPSMAPPILCGLLPNRSRYRIPVRRSLTGLSQNFDVIGYSFRCPPRP
jgi:hypothetical protein